MRRQNKIEQILESALWSVRFFTIIPVFFGVLSVISFFWLGSIEILYGLGMYRYLSEDRHKYIAKIVSSIIGGVDLYLMGIVLILFSFGIYELFISKIDIGRANQEIRILEIKSLEQLKDKILKVIVMVLVVSFFKTVMEREISNSLDLLYLAISILLIALSGYLLRISPKHKEQSDSDYH